MGWGLQLLRQCSIACGKWASPKFSAVLQRMSNWKTCPASLRSVFLLSDTSRMGTSSVPAFT